MSPSRVSPTHAPPAELLGANPLHPASPTVPHPGHPRKAHPGSSLSSYGIPERFPWVALTQGTSERLLGATLLPSGHPSRVSPTPGIPEKLPQGHSFLHITLDSHPRSIPSGHHRKIPLEPSSPLRAPQKGSPR